MSSIGGTENGACFSYSQLDLLAVIEQMRVDMDSYIALMDQTVAPSVYADAIVETFTGVLLEPRHFNPLNENTAS